MDEENKHTVKRKDLGIAGTLIVLAEAISNFQSSRSVSFDVLKLKEDILQMKSDREQYFVKKKELSTVVKKLDHMNHRIGKIDEKVASLKHLLKDDLSLNAVLEEDPEFVGCSYRPNLLPRGFHGI